MTKLVKPRKRGGDSTKLNACQQKFVLELLALGMVNCAEAVRRAYPNCKNPAQYATKLLKMPRIQAVLGKTMQEDVERLQLDRDLVLKHLYFAVTANRAGLFDEKGIMVLNHQVVDGEVVGSTIHDLPEALQQCINGIKQRVKRYEVDGAMVEVVETELKFIPKESAIEMAMKHKGLFAPEQHEHKLTIDWATMMNPPQGENVIEAEFKKLEEPK